MPGRDAPEFEVSVLGAYFRAVGLPAIITAAVVVVIYILVSNWEIIVG